MLHSTTINAGIPSHDTEWKPTACEKPIASEKISVPANANVRAR